MTARRGGSPGLYSRKSLTYMLAVSITQGPCMTVICLRNGDDTDLDLPMEPLNEGERSIWTFEGVLYTK